MAVHLHAGIVTKSSMTVKVMDHALALPALPVMIVAWNAYPQQTTIFFPPFPGHRHYSALALPSGLVHTAIYLRSPVLKTEALQLFNQQALLACLMWLEA